MVLLAVLQAGQKQLAYGVTIHRELTTRARRTVARGAVYMTLDRLERKGFLKSALADPTPERGGRAKRYFRITKAGIREVRDAQRSLMNLWRGLPELRGEKA